ncbi:hypothetical protein Hdeb2414_s0006g00214001 [Helianthus debilis subsp. tardiflorus]
MANNDEPIPWKDDRTEEQKYNYRKMLAEYKIIRISRIFLEARRAGRWDPKRECYLDEYGNIAIDDKTLDIEAIIKEYKEDDEYWQHKWWGTPTEKMIEEEKERKEKEEKERKEEEEKKMNGKCSNCEKSETDNVKFLKDMESLTLENKTLKIEKKADDEQILELCLICEKLKSENDKLLKNIESLSLENKNFKKLESDFKSRIKILENERDIFGKNNLEKQSEINSHLDKIIQLEHEAEDARKKIVEFENKILKEKEKDFESKRKSSENEDFWIKLENKNLKENEIQF